ncbi:MAG TPA: DNA-processing protein DprA, partial [Tepidisphaeraceae bacterium]
MAVHHWLTLAHTSGIGPVLSRRLIELTGSAEAATRADEETLRRVEGIGSKAGKIAASLKLAHADADKQLAAAEAKRVSIICSDDEAYPHLLRTLPDAPLVLYVVGTLEPRDLNSVAIVGSRKCSLYGREQAERFGGLLAGAGFTVLSGGARGVDSAAHHGAIAHGSGRTIAVLGCGLDIAYPAENLALFQQIAEHGAVISEFPIGTPPAAENFPKRNRIVSGMSRGVLVIEADERSGALITARQAIEEHNRPVMAVPGRCDNPQSAGPHKLIREGATLVTRLEHILEALGPLNASLPEVSLFESAPARTLLTPAPPPKPVDPLNESQQKLLGVLGVDPLGVDDIADASGLDVSHVMRDLMFLTLKGR